MKIAFHLRRDNCILSGEFLDFARVPVKGEYIVFSDGGPMYKVVFVVLVGSLPNLVDSKYQAEVFAVKDDEMETVESLANYFATKAPVS